MYPYTLSFVFLHQVFPFTLEIVVISDQLTSLKATFFLHTHYNLVTQIFRYLSRTFNLRITFTINSEVDPVVYTDSDYAKLING